MESTDLAKLIDLATPFAIRVAITLHLPELVAGGTKTSFCLTDVDQWPTTLPNTSADGSYFTCDPKMQGISVGWADVYSYTLPDNNIVSFASGVNVPAQTVSPAVGDGVYLMLRPLSVGQHVAQD